MANVVQEDMRKVAVERKGETNFFTSSMIKDCMKKVTTVSLHETVQVPYCSWSSVLPGSYILLIVQVYHEH